MSIAEKLQTIAENEQMVYAKGKSDGYQDGYGSGSVDGYSIGFNNGYDLGYKDGKAEGGGGDSGSYDKGFEDGKKAEYDAFWDAFQNGGEPTGYSFAFRSTCWTDDNYNPAHDLVCQNAIGLGNTFNGCKLSDTKKPVIFKSGGNVSNAFYNASFMKTIRPITLAEGLAFSEQCFYNCSALENIEFVGTLESSLNLQWSTKLSAASIERIISALSTETENLSITLSKDAVDKAFETEDGLKDGSDSEYWNETLVGSKYMWSIHLV